MEIINVGRGVEQSEFSDIGRNVNEESYFGKIVPQFLKH